ncbi:MAG: hypothetical protein FJ347_08925 [Sphingomonadales bacterium]|nr:hypothetical protein [Sphingomonadales bacterium]
MAVFIVESDIPELTPAFMRLIPQHMDIVQRLFSEEKILLYAVSEDRTRWWCHIEAEDESEVMDILAQMPIMPYMRPKIHDLMFYNMAEIGLPKISLN